MADELIENAEYGRKRKNQEDPILVAQRFLNIYRQMHIFNKQRQEQFDDMLLELPPDIRILLSTLPGGSLLLEHIEELEQKRGLVSVPVENENSLRKKNTNELLKRTSNSDKSVKVSSAGSVVIDSSFASELSTSLSLAFQQTEKRYKEDIRTLTENITHSIMESQTAIANMMKDILMATRGVSGVSDNDNAALRVLANEKPPVKSLSNEKILTETVHHALKQNDNPQTEPIEVKIERPGNIDSDISGKQPLAETPAKAQNKNVFTQPADVQEGSLNTPEPDLSEVADLKEEYSSPENNTGVNLAQVNSLAKDLNKRLGKNNKNKTEPSKNMETAVLETARPFSPSPKAEDSLPAQASEKRAPHVSAPVLPVDSHNVLNEELPKSGRQSTKAELEPDTSFDFDNLLKDKSTETKNNKSKSDLHKNQAYQNEMSQIRNALQGLEKIDNNLKAAEPLLPSDASLDLDDTSSLFNDLAAEPVSLDDLPDEPISLDDISDDFTSFNLSDNNEESSYSANHDQVSKAQKSKLNTQESTPTSSQVSSQTLENMSPVSSNDDNNWEWEYVDDQGEPVDSNGDEWEWEYVEDENGSDDDSADWEWEYVEDETDSDNKKP